MIRNYRGKMLLLFVLIAVFIVGCGTVENIGEDADSDLITTDTKYGVHEIGDYDEHSDGSTPGRGILAKMEACNEKIMGAECIAIKPSGETVGTCQLDIEGRLNGSLFEGSLVCQSEDHED